MLLREVVSRVTSLPYEPEAVVMGRMPDGRLVSVLSIDIERHSPEDSVGGTTVWINLEDY